MPASGPETSGEVVVSASNAATSETPVVPAEAPPAPNETRTPQRRPGRRPGAPEHNRTRRLHIDAERTHTPTCFRGCAEPLSPAVESRAHNAR
jgi:hypothetical protein